MSELPLISVLVPVYNVEPFLAATLRAALAQTWRGGLEIVAVNDGSTDNSLSVLREYARRDPRVRVVDKPNEGVAATRQRCLHEARGQFIFWLDADDTISPNALEVLFEALTGSGAEAGGEAQGEGSAAAAGDGSGSDGCDVATAKIVGVRGNVQKPLFPSDAPRELDTVEFIRALLTNSVTRGVAGRMYRREAFDGVEFYPGVRTGEDWLANMQIAMRPGFRGECRCDDAVYYYIRNENSITHQRLPFEATALTMEHLGRLLDGFCADHPSAARALHDQLVMLYITPVHDYIRRSGNPWRGDHWMAGRACEAVVSAPGDVRRLAPSGAGPMIRLYRYRGLKWAVDMIAMFTRLGRSLKKRMRL